VFGQDHRHHAPPCRVRPGVPRGRCRAV